ncbi:MAG: NAD(P)/FAD-dependent oxidoreductase [Verrucomicrobia bacterium]|nr:NAD(P)/FAD-dependent oxidoreductase [Verrucomicrobiota bacterium]
MTVDNSIASKAKHSILILGGGFAGRDAALTLAKLFPDESDAEITLVDASPFLVFTPMLTEAAGGELEVTHIAVPALRLTKRIKFAQGQVTRIGLAEKKVDITIGDSMHGTPETQRTLAWDQLVIALGSVTNYHDIPGLEEHALTMKHLRDARILRNRILGLLERANDEPDAKLRRILLTVVVGGGGFTGIETIAAINGLVRDLIKKFPRINKEDVRMVVAHHGDRILPELGPALADYAAKKLKELGVEILYKTGVKSAGSDYVELSSGEKINTYTLIWAGGVKPNPAVEKAECARGHHGGIIVDRFCAVKNHPGVWAVGDCAEVPTPDLKGTYAPTAQNATREGVCVARNIAATLRGGTLEAFRFKPVGELALIGKRAGVARVYGFNFSGAIAWMLWRGIYWLKMPDIGQRVRVAVDWALDVLFGRNVIGETPLND